MAGAILVIMLAMAVATLGRTSKFPSDVKICSAKDPNINLCFTDTANKMLLHLRKGIRKLGMVPTEPLQIPLLGLDKENTVLPGLSFILSNSTHLGWGDAVATEGRADPTNYSFELTFFLPTYEVFGDYVIDGRLLFINLEGEGKLNLKFYDNTYRVRVGGEPVSRAGKVHMNITRFVIDATVNDMHFDVENLFNNKALSDATNSLLNWNSKSIAQAGAPALQDIYGELYMLLMQRLFDKVPYSELFTDLN